MCNHLASRKHQAGATLVEYGLLLTLIAMAVVTSVFLIGKDLDSKFEQLRVEFAAADQRNSS